MPDLPSPHEEWIYNPANIDAAPVIWALDLGPTENEELRRYYAGRSFWRFKPAQSMSLSPVLADSDLGLTQRKLAQSAPTAHGNSHHYMKNRSGQLFISLIYIFAIVPL